MNDEIRYEQDISVTVLEYTLNQKKELLEALCSTNASDFQNGQEITLSVPAQPDAQGGPHGELKALMEISVVWKIKSANIFKCHVIPNVGRPHDLLPDYEY